MEITIISPTGPRISMKVDLKTTIGEVHTRAGIMMELRIDDFRLLHRGVHLHDKTKRIRDCKIIHGDAIKAIVPSVLSLSKNSPLNGLSLKTRKLLAARSRKVILLAQGRFFGRQRCQRNERSQRRSSRRLGY